MLILALCLYIEESRERLLALFISFSFHPSNRLDMLTDRLPAAEGVSCCAMQRVSGSPWGKWIISQLLRYCTSANCVLPRVFPSSKFCPGRLLSFHCNSAVSPMRSEKARIAYHQTVQLSCILNWHCTLSCLYVIQVVNLKKSPVV
jgi:hypothetical protein